MYTINNEVLNVMEEEIKIEAYKFRPGQKQEIIVNTACRRYLGNIREYVLAMQYYILTTLTSDN